MKTLLSIILMFATAFITGCFMTGQIVGHDKAFARSIPSKLASLPKHRARAKETNLFILIFQKHGTEAAYQEKGAVFADFKVTAAIVEARKNAAKHESAKPTMWAALELSK